VNHGKVVRAVLAVTILVMSVVFALTESPRLGLDLRGGTQITLETRDSLAARQTGSPPNGPWRCCAFVSTRSVSPNRLSPSPVSAGSSSSAWGE
jgi:hypothetical protein